MKFQLWYLFDMINLIIQIKIINGCCLKIADDLLIFLSINNFINVVKFTLLKYFFYDIYNVINSDRFQTASMIHFISVFGLVFDVFSRYWWWRDKSGGCLQIFFFFSSLNVVFYMHVFFTNYFSNWIILPIFYFKKTLLMSRNSPLSGRLRSGTVCFPINQTLEISIHS